ncbi:14627_t:CDS:1, partial [Funneliformis geosporum]
MTKDNSYQTAHEKVQSPTHVPTSFKWSQGGDHVSIAGSFDPPIQSWTPIEMPKNSNNVHEVTLNLLPNKKYFFKFVVDDKWVLDPTLESCLDEIGNYNHEICVEPLKPCLDEGCHLNSEVRVEPLKSSASETFIGKDRGLKDTVVEEEHVAVEEHEENNSK